MGVVKFTGLLIIILFMFIHPFQVSGVTFGNNQKALEHLTKYNSGKISVELVRENNEHDANAVAVTISVNNSKAYQIGFLPRKSLNNILFCDVKFFKITKGGISKSIILHVAKQDYLQY